MRRPFRACGTLSLESRPPCQWLHLDSILAPSAVEPARSYGAQAVLEHSGDLQVQGVHKRRWDPLRSSGYEPGEHICCFPPGLCGSTAAIPASICSLCFCCFTCLSIGFKGNLSLLNNLFPGDLSNGRVANQPPSF